MSLTSLPLLQSSQTNIYKKSYGEWVKTGRNGSKFTIKKMLYQHNGYYHLIFNKKFYVSIKPFLIYNFTIIKKEAPSDFWATQGVAKENQLQKLGVLPL